MITSFVDDTKKVGSQYDSVLLPGFEEIRVGDAITLVADSDNDAELAVRLKGEMVVLLIGTCSMKGEVVEFSGGSVTVEIKSIGDTEVDDEH